MGSLPRRGGEVDRPGWLPYSTARGLTRDCGLPTATQRFLRRTRLSFLPSWLEAPCNQREDGEYLCFNPEEICRTAGLSPFRLLEVAGDPSFRDSPRFN